MKKLNLKSILALVLTLMLSLTCLAGCGQRTPNETAEVTSGGVICLKVNPEIAIAYDENGNVTKIDARNDDGSKILADYIGYEGKSCKEVVAELVTAIGNAGYFVEEIEGESRKITIEIETGSKLPSNSFLDDVVAEVRNCVNNNNWQNPVDVTGESDYGITDYIDTDYGPDNDGVTDYNDTDYGPNNDGVTDYNDTDYGPNNDGVTDYDDTDYGPNNDGVTDYDDTDYGPNNDGVTDYAPAPTPAPTTPAPGPSAGSSDYNDGNSNYDDGNSNYGDGSNYGGDSGYDD